MGGIAGAVFGVGAEVQETRQAPRKRIPVRIPVRLDLARMCHTIRATSRHFETSTPFTSSHSIKISSAVPPTPITTGLTSIASGGHRKVSAATPPIMNHTPIKRGRKVDL